ncbi:MAG: ribulose-phosphate 3-epimerase [Candidatus Kapaibacteriales bacterium]
MPKDIKILPSMLSADFLKIGDEIKMCEVVGADMLHADIMDGHFVPNISYGPMIVEHFCKATKLPVDVHLMISDADKYVEDFAKAGAYSISVHAEACPHLHRSIQNVKSFGCQAGLVLNPVTPLEFAYEIINELDFVLLMSVNPGFGGQKFIKQFLNRCERLRRFADDNGRSDMNIQVDGGITASNIRQVVDAGADWIVSGSGLFKGNMKENMAQMRNALNDIEN